jgi:hypothetical protein
MVGDGGFFSHSQTKKLVRKRKEKYENIWWIASWIKIVLSYLYRWHTCATEAL